MKTSSFILFLVYSCVNTSKGSHVLVVFPVPGKSHSILGNSIVNILLDAGHQVTYVTPFPLETNNTKLKNADISSILFDMSDNERLNIEKMAGNQKPSHWILHVGSMFAAKALRHSAVQEILNDPRSAFDVVIAEWFYSGLLAPLAAVYECPLIWYSSGDVSWQSLRMVHEASSPAYSVDLQSSAAPAAPFTSGDKIRQLMLQVYLSGWIFYLTNYVEKPEYRKIFSAPLLLRGRPVADYESIAYNASLLLINSHPPLGQNVPLPRSAKYIGGHHLSSTPRPLPLDLKRLLDESTQGVVYFSMGSNLKARDLPESMKRELLTMFGMLEQTVLWKLEEDLEDVPSNVHILEWAPQESILTHENLILVISHGGLLTITEATHHGVPMIGIPIYGDQFVNVDLVVQRGCGLRVDYSNDLPNKIREAVDEIISNSSYRFNAKSVSSVFRRRLASPQKELLHWVELVIYTRGAEFLRSPALSIPTLQRLHFDVLLLIVSLLWFLSKVVNVIKAHFNQEDGADVTKKDD
ncbi:unnamed protein product, partial [Iphiclides podalirius]